VKTAYLDGELCAVRPDGVPAFAPTTWCSLPSIFSI
jgi:hypothetical protein